MKDPILLCYPITDTFLGFADLASVLVENFSWDRLKRLDKILFFNKETRVGIVNILIKSSPLTN